MRAGPIRTGAPSQFRVVFGCDILAGRPVEARPNAPPEPAIGYGSY